MQARIFAPVVLAASFMAAVQPAARSDASSDVKKALQTVYAKRDSAIEKKDIQGSLSMIAPDFIFVAKDGQKGDARVVKQRLTPLLALVQSVKSRSLIQRFVLKGKQATVLLKQHLEMMLVNPETQAPQKFAADATSEDLWVKSGSRWLQRRRTTKSEMAVLAGRKIDDRINLGGKRRPNGGRQ
jgi:hypothetical protein